MWLDHVIKKIMEFISNCQFFNRGRGSIKVVLKRKKG